MGTLPVVASTILFSILNSKSKTMTHTEVIERLCKLHSEAAEHVGYEYAADCFCGEGGFWSVKGYNPKRDYRNDGKALEFMEAAVREKLARGHSPENAQAMASADEKTTPKETTL